MKHIHEKIEKTLLMLRDLEVVQQINCRGFQYKVTGYKEGNRVPVVDDTWEELTDNILISEKDVHTWIVGDVRIPKVKEGEYAVLEFYESNTKCDVQTCFYVDGELLQEFDKNHIWARLEDDKEYRVAFYNYYSLITPYMGVRPSVKIISEKVEKLYYDMAVPFDAMSVLSADSIEYKKIGKYLINACNLIDFREPHTREFYKSIDNAISYLQKEFYEKECGDRGVTVHCIGHSHIDVAWTWRTAQTREKIQRTISMVLKLMDEYPEHRFMLTQPQLFQFLKEEAPELFEKVKERVAEGRFEVEGAMWLEADGNLPSGESFIRQIIYGKRFIREEFGKESRLFWIPDVFGYSAALPQILRKCGVDRFVTGKISWNDTNRMPNDTFYWRGIDGSRIFAQFLTTRDFNFPDKTMQCVNFNGVLNAEDIQSSWENYRNKEYSNEIITSYGYGDGGGGPSREMLERQRRFAYGLPGMPKTKISSVNEFLDCVSKNFEKSCKELQKTPEWTGELYLEYHRGTYTSMAKNKKKNRFGEFLLYNAELLSVNTMLLNKTPYPADELEKAWRLMLLNQFHDIIPGSSTKAVYEDSDKDYEKIFAIAGKIVDQNMKMLAGNIQTEGGYLVYNPCAYKRDDVIKVNGVTAYVQNIPAMGWKVVKELQCTNQIAVEEHSIISEDYILRLNSNGNIISLYDRTEGRELIAEGCEANRLVAYEDVSRHFAAWEIRPYYDQKAYAINQVESISEICDGVRKGLQITRTYKTSSIKQNIWLYQNMRRIDFETVIDWKEKNILLKALFPLAIQSNQITGEIQFGNVERSTHNNTSWDEAKFEMCMHKWVDLSDNGYGVSILNDCKYGYSCRGNEIGISLLKSSTSPNPDADKEIHEFTYSLYPHKGRYYEAETIKQAYNLNNPLGIRELCPGDGGAWPEEYSLAETDRENVMIETVKKCERDNSVIVRAYECHNMCGDTRIHFGFPIKEAYLCDMEEKEIQKLPVKDNAVALRLHNFEIVTLKLWSE